MVQSHQIAATPAAAAFRGCLRMQQQLGCPVLAPQVVCVRVMVTPRAVVWLRCSPAHQAAAAAAAAQNHQQQVVVRILHSSKGLHCLLTAVKAAAQGLKTPLLR